MIQVYDCPNQIMRMQSTVAVDVFFVMMAGVSKSATAAPFYVAADFSETNNPSGVWIYASFDPGRFVRMLSDTPDRSAWWRQQYSRCWPDHHYAGKIKVKYEILRVAARFKTGCYLARLIPTPARWRDVTFRNTAPSVAYVGTPSANSLIRVGSIGLAESGWSLPRAGHVLIDKNRVPVGIDQHQACGS